MLILPTVYGLPTSSSMYYSGSTFNVDIQRFSSLFSTHLLFDHIDGTLSFLSKRISLSFQDLIQVTPQPPFDINDDAFVIVDVELLKGQLQGAVGCK
jgi:hypothetical protein